MTPEQLVAQAAPSFAGYGVVGAVALVFLSLVLYTFKRLLDRTLDKGDQAMTSALTKLDKIDGNVVTLREELISELRELRHELMMALGQARASEGSGVRAVPPRR